MCPGRFLFECPGRHLYSLCAGRHLCPDVPVCNFVRQKHDVSQPKNMTSPGRPTQKTWRQSTHKYDVTRQTHTHTEKLIFIYIDLWEFPMWKGCLPIYSWLVSSQLKHKYMTDKNNLNNLKHVLSNNKRYIDDVLVLNYKEFYWYFQRYIFIRAYSFNLVMALV